MLHWIYCRGRSGENRLHRSKRLYQCPHDDWEGFHPAAALSGERGEADPSQKWVETV